MSSRLVRKTMKRRETVYVGLCYEQRDFLNFILLEKLIFGYCFLITGLF